MRYKFLFIIILSSLASSQDLDWTNSGFENGSVDWSVFPSDFNASVVEEFSYEGSKSMKIIPYTESGHYARVGKEYHETAAENLAGSTIRLEAQFYTSSDDVYWLGGDTVRFVAMYFDQGWTEIRFDYSENFDLNVDSWNYKNLISTVPSNAHHIVFGINATGDESVGSIYVDNFTGTLIPPGPINVSGIISSNTTWSVLSSPYIVTGDIQISPEATLTIDPGVEVKIDGAYFIHVGGGFFADGNPENRITFTSNSTSQDIGDWQILFSAPSSSGSITYCNFLYGSSYQVIYANSDTNALLSIKNNIFQNNTILIRTGGLPCAIEGNIFIDYSGWAVNAKYYTLSNNTFINGYGGLYTVGQSSEEIYNNVFYKVNRAIYHQDGGGSTSIENCTIINAGTQGGIEESYGSISNCTFISNQKAITVVRIPPNPIVNNNFIDNIYNLYVTEDWSDYNTLNAENNWWGTSNTTEISESIYDYYDNFMYTEVDYVPYLTSINTEAPISPPENVFKQLSGNDLILTWEANPESDLVGYKLHYGNFTGYSYTTNIDLGNVTTYTLSGASIDSSIAVTAYDGNIDGSDDQVEGYQSWFSEANLPPYNGPVWHVSTSGSDNNSGNEENPFATIQNGINSADHGDTIYVSAGNYSENINFGGKNILLKGEGVESTFIDGNHNGSVVTFNGGESPDAIIRGFTIINGNASYGGGFYIKDSDPTLDRLKIINNNGNEGGGVFIEDSEPILNNILISNNSSEIGGGIYCYSQGDPTLMNVTISANSGQGLRNTYAHPVVTNTIIWGNSEEDYFVDISGMITATNSNIGGGVFGSDNIDTDPLFIDSENGDFRLGNHSPVIGAGTLTNAPLLDIEGNPRPTPEGTNPDMGAYENPLGTPLARVINVPNDFATIQEGINESNNGDTVFVEPGTYIENINFDGKNIVVLGENRETTIIDGNQNGSVVTFESGENENAVLKSFTIINAGGHGNNFGGGIFVQDQSTPILDSLIIDGNSGGGYEGSYGGGGICVIEPGSKVSIFNSIIKNSSGESEVGGLFSCQGGWIVATNCIIADNSNSGVQAGCGSGSNDSPIDLINCTITNNSYYGVYMLGPSTISITNSIIHNNIDYYGNDLSYYLWEGGSLFINESLVSGGYAGPGVIDADPLFCDPQNGDYTLAQNSPCAGTGINGGNMGALDVGCESVEISSQVFYVATTGSSNNDGSEENPFSSIQQAIDASIDGDTVMVASGNYEENFNFNGKNISVLGEDKETTFVDGRLIGSVVTIASGEDTTAVLSGFSIINGLNHSGGGIYIENSSPKIINSIINDNNSSGSTFWYHGGGGIYCNNSNPIIRDVTISNNASEAPGGGIYLVGGSNPIIEDVIISNNYTNNNISGSGIKNSDSSPILKNVLIVGNMVDGTDRGGGIFNGGPSSILTLDQVTIVGNSFNGIYTTGGQLNIQNSILRDNGSVGDDIYDYNNNSVISVSYSNISGGYPGTGNIDANPLFCNLDNIDYSLAENSPCIGTGIDGVNMGAYGVGCEAFSIPTEIYFSEWSEGMNYNKYLEIYNGSGDDFDLSQLSISRCANGCEETNALEYPNDIQFSPGTIIADGDVFVLTHPQADEAIISQADYTEWTYISNGDDALALTMSGATETEYIIIDIIGDLSEDDPGEGWPVAGVPDATRNHTMVRKSSVTTGNGGNWESSAGTDGNDSEWIVYEMEDRTNLGFHIENGSGGFINDGLDDDIDWTNKSTQLSANWRSGIIEDAVHYEYAIGIFQSPSTEILSWTTTAGNSVDTAFTHTGLSLVEGATYYSHIRGLDAEGNIIETTDTVSSDGVTIDITLPQIEYIIEGDLSQDYDYQRSTDTLILSWSALEDASGIIEYEYAWGTSANDSDLVNWVSTDDQLAITDGMDLISGSTYFGSVRANDLAGNRGMVLSGNGVTVDNTPPTLGTVDDILNNTAEDLDFSAVTDTIYARWYNFNDELSGINNYKYAIGTQPGGTQNLYWTLSETGNQIAESGLTLIHGITYYVSVKATDYVGNESGFAASDGITIDIQPPTGGYVNDGSNDDLDYSVSPNTLEGNWGDFSDDLSGIISYEYAVGTLEGYDDIIPWTLCWLDTNFYNDQLVLENGRTYYTSVRAKDLVGNVSVPISSNGVTIDFNLPEISYLYEGDLTIDRDDQTSTDTIILSWDILNNESTVGYYEYAIGTEPESTNIVDWTNNGTETHAIVTGLNLQYGSTYYGSVKAYDENNYSSQVFAGDGITILDDEAPVMGSIIDGMDEDNAYINTTNSAGASWYGFYDEGIGISSYEYALGTANDIESIISFTPAGLQSSIMVEGLSLAHGSSYVFSVTAIDSMDNRSDTASSNGFTVDLYPGPPQISSLSLDTLSIISSTLDTVIEVFFTEPIIGPNVALNGILQESYPSSATYFNDPPKLFITLDAPFISMDTLIININNISDLAGINGSDMSLTYYAGLLADYNKDEVVDVLDLAKFIQSWNADDYSFELGPAIGMVPYLKPNPDNEFTIRDAMTFSRMWYWSNSTSMNALASGTNIGSSIEIYQTGTRILIVPPHESIASEIAIEYPTKSMEFNNNSNNQNSIEMSKHYEKDQVFIHVNGLVDFENSASSGDIIYDVSGAPGHDIDLLINYRFVDEKNKIISSGTHQLNYLPIPDEISLHQNYPNPFNPITEIKYDIPKEQHVQLYIFDILGRKVTTLINGIQQPGYLSVKWDGTDEHGTNVSAGMYFYSIQAENFRQVKKMVLLK